MCFQIHFILLFKLAFYCWCFCVFCTYDWSKTYTLCFFDIVFFVALDTLKHIFCTNHKPFKKIWIVFRNIKADEIAIAKSNASAASKSGGRSKEKKDKSIDMVDAIGTGDAGKEDTQNDSFEKYYNKDLDLDEGKTHTHIIHSFTLYIYILLSNTYIIHLFIFIYLFFDLSIGK